MSTGSVLISSHNERLQYDNAKAALLKAPGVSPDALNNAVMTQSFLRLIQPLSTNNTIFKFPVLNNQQGTGQPIRPDEQRLNQQDAMFVSKIFVKIFKAANATTYSWVPNTYPNAVTFPTGSAATGLYSFYCGSMQIVINNSVIVPAYPVQNFLVVPQTQLTAATNSPQDQYDGTLIMPWEPNVVLVGLYNSIIQIVLPQGMTAVDANTYAVIEVQGILAQNVALGAPN